MDASSALRLKNKRIWVSAHDQPLGRSIVRRLWRERCEIVLADASQLNLLRQREVEDWFARQRPEVVFLTDQLSASSGSPDGSATRTLHDHLACNLNVLAAARSSGVATLVNLTANRACSRTRRPRAARQSAAAGRSTGAIAETATIELTLAHGIDCRRRYHVLLADSLFGSAEFAATDADLLRLVARLAEASYRRQPQVALDRAPDCLLHVDDLADAAVFVAENCHSGQVYRCAPDECRSVAPRSLADLVADVVGYAGRVTLPSHAHATPERYHEFMDVAVLGWCPRTALRERIARIHREWAGRAAGPSDLDLR